MVRIPTAPDTLAETLVTAIARDLLTQQMKPLDPATAAAARRNIEAAARAYAAVWRVGPHHGALATALGRIPEEARTALFDALTPPAQP